jgi:hypothetical protein
MIAKSIGGNDYRIIFGRQKKNGCPVSTTCAIEEVETGKRFNDEGSVVGTGIAKCDSRDNFIKEVGRKLALKDALAGSSLSKVDRTKIWCFYFNR